MFEKQRLNNRGFEFLYDRAETCLNAYPYLQDFCTYLNLNRKLEWLETYFVYSEVFWLESLYLSDFDRHY